VKLLIKKMRAGTNHPCFLARHRLFARPCVSAQTKTSNQQLSAGSKPSHFLGGFQAQSMKLELALRVSFAQTQSFLNLKHPIMFYQSTLIC
jgi:hypothetical protein